MGGLGGLAAKEYKQMQNRTNPANSCDAPHHGNSPDFDLNGNKFDTVRNLFPARHIAGFPQFLFIISLLFRILLGAVHPAAVQSQPDPGQNHPCPF